MLFQALQIFYTYPQKRNINFSYFSYWNVLVLFAYFNKLSMFYILNKLWKLWKLFEFVYSSTLLPFSIKSTNTIQKYPHYLIVCWYSKNVCYSFVSYESFLEYVKLESCQNRLHYNYYEHTKLSNEFLLIHTHQDLSHTPHPLFW